jgi:hypothetical protein
MRYSQDKAARAAFRDWLREQMRRQHYRTPGGHYNVAEFAAQHGLTAVSVGRYIREARPVLPTPEMCRDLATATGENYVDVLRLAGYQTQDDLDIYVQEAIDSGRFDVFCRARFDPVAA